MQARAGAHDVDDGVDRADLVEMHLVGRDAMHVRLGLGQPLEHRAGALLDRVGQPAGADDPEDVAQAALHVLLALHLHEGPRGAEGPAPHGLSRDRVALQR
jgi:hypothetical protein